MGINLDEVIGKMQTFKKEGWESYLASLSESDISYLFDEWQERVIKIQSQFFAYNNALEILKKTPEKKGRAKKILEAFDIGTEKMPNPLDPMKWISNRAQGILKELQKLVQLGVQFFSSAKNKSPVLKKMQSIDFTLSWPPAITFSFKL